MYFTVNAAFVNYLDSLDNLTISLKALILINRKSYKQTLPISLPPPEFGSKLLTAPKTLKDFIYQFQQKKDIFHLQERHTDKELDLPTNNLFFNNYISDIFLFVATIILLLVTTLIMYILCNYKKLKTLVASLVTFSSNTGKDQTSTKY